MDFSGPDELDFEDIFELNVDFLRLLRNHSVAARLLAEPADTIAAKLRSLGDRQIRRLAQCPFLLCCCREDDIDFWLSALSVNPDQDLFVSGESVSNDESRLISATLGFSWQLVRRNPFTARLVCGASTAWCDEIAAQPLVRLVNAGSAVPQVLSLRLPMDKAFWSRLLSHGLHDDPATRRAARLTALHSILLRPRSSVRLAAAARHTNVPSLLLTN